MLRISFLGVSQSEDENQIGKKQFTYCTLLKKHTIISLAIVTTLGLMFANGSAKLDTLKSF